MRKFYAILLLVILLLVFSIPALAEEARKEAPAQQIWGFGLVVGLEGTGDVKISDRTREAAALARAQGNLGLPADFYKPGNIAYVTIIADLPPQAQPGQQIDALLAVLGDATDLRGGILLSSPLKGADDQVYALAQGTISADMVGLAGLTGFEGPFTRARLVNGVTLNRPVTADPSNEGQARYDLVVTEPGAGARVPARPTARSGQMTLSGLSARPGLSTD